MTQVAEKASAFASALEKRPQGGPRWLDDLRARGAAKFTALDVPQDHMLLVVQHEVFGHGARLR